MTIELNIDGQFWGQIHDTAEYYAFGYSQEKEKTCLSKSFLKGIENNPFEWKNAPGFVPTPASIHGSMVDCLITTPHLFESMFVVSPYKDFRTKESQKWRDEQTTLGNEIVKPGQVTAAKYAAGRLKKFLTDCGIELGVTHLPQVAGITHVTTESGRQRLIKCLMDFAPIQKGGRIFDLKTTGIDISNDRELLKLIANMGYHEQAGEYMWIYKEIHGVLPDGFTLLFQRNVSPNIFRRVDLLPSDIMTGLSRIEKKVNLFDRCASSGIWPGEVVDPLVGGLPEWANDKINEWRAAE